LIRSRIIWTGTWYHQSRDHSIPYRQFPIWIFS